MGDPPPLLDRPQSHCISTTDHLPCDVIRSLWLVQRLNLEVDKIKRRFHHDAKAAETKSDDPKLWYRIQRDKRRVEWLNSQAVAETQAILRQLECHRQWLLDSAAQQEQIKSTKEEAKERQNSLELRLQLMKHYEEHPLNSHLEALKEDAPQEKLKLVLKVPASAKMVAAKPKKSGRPVGRPRLKTANDKRVNGAITVTRELRQRNSTPTPTPEPSTNHLISTPRRTRSSTPTPATSSVSPIESKSTTPPDLDEANVNQAIKPRSKTLLKSSPRKNSKRSPKKNGFKTPLKANLKTSLKASSEAQLKPKPKRPVGRPRKNPVKVEIELDMEEIEEEKEPVYCFCQTPSLGNMIACDNLACPNGEWFHFKCVGLLNRVQALKYTLGNEKWFCSEKCRVVSQSTKKNQRKAPKKASKKHSRRKRWTT